MLSTTIAEILSRDDPWRYATFEGAVQLQLKIDARTSLAEKLEWLEQAGWRGNLNAKRTCWRLANFGIEVRP